MYDPSFIGTIAAYAGNRIPSTWMLCQGQLLSIPGNDALFGLIGTTFGGDGINNFALPNLCGRTAVNAGQAPNMQNYQVGQKGGNETILITTNNLPAHTHALTQPITATPPCSTIVGDLSSPTGNYPAQLAGAPAAYSNAAASANLGVTNLSLVTPPGPIEASEAPVPVLSPYLVMNYVICIEGVWPSKE